MPKILTTLIILFFINLAQAKSLQEMQSELDSAQYARAATTGLALLRQQPDNPRIQFLLALAFQKNNQEKQAIRYYKKIISSHPELPEPRNNLAIIFLQQGNYDKAIQLLIASLNTHPAYATAYKNLNNIYQGLASEAYRKALNDDLPPDNILSKIKLTELTELQQSVIVANNSIQQPVQTARLDKKTTAPEVPAPTPHVVAVVPKPEKPVSQAITIKQEIKPARQTVSDKAYLIQRVKNWADAWSKQQFDQYVSSYTDSFSGRYASHAQWVKERRKRVVRVDHIEVTLSKFKVKSIGNNQATIDFHQAYQSSTYSDEVIKRVQLKKVNNDWKISREVTLAVL
jgi:tetratricopeptide (TPR) repeat protein